MKKIERDREREREGWKGRENRTHNINDSIDLNWYQFRLETF